MTPYDFLKTIYLGDRSCIGLTIDTSDNKNAKINILVDCISRVRPGTSQWDFYADEDVINGSLTFSQIRSFSIYPGGYLPNGHIDSIEVIKNDEYWKFTLKIESLFDRDVTQQTLIIEAKEIDVSK
jgi:hypothetical protein